MKTSGIKPHEVFASIHCHFGLFISRPQDAYGNEGSCIEKTKTTPEDIVVMREIHGPNACRQALTTFMEAHPETRIGGVAPILTPSIHVGLEDGIYVEEGTQHLLVTHTNENGPWPQAKELRIELTTFINSTACRCKRRKSCTLTIAITPAQNAAVANRQIQTSSHPGRSPDIRALAASNCWSLIPQAFADSENVVWQNSSAPIAVGRFIASHF